MTGIAIITGASEGLSRTFTYQLAKAGCTTVNVARNQARLESLVAELGERHQYLVADLSTEAGINTCLEFIKANRIDMLVNNAGVSQFGTFRDASITDEIKTFNVNCYALMRLSHAFLE